MGLQWLVDLIPAIQTMEDLQVLVREGFGDVSRVPGTVKHWEHYGQVNVKYHDGLVMFSYANECAFKPPEVWNYFERVSRGLILNSLTGEIVARPFDKFWNYGQVEPGPGAKIVDVTEKMDGSLGILYRHKGELRVATRGSFDSDQAVWATEWFNTHMFLWADSKFNWTILFEIIYPENRVVVDYHGWSGLVLLGARDLVSGHEIPVSSLKNLIKPAAWIKFPQTYTFNEMADVLAARENLTANEEGFVVLYNDGTRLKIKGDEYLQLHKFVSNFSFKNVAIAMRDGKIDDVMAMCPPNYRDQLAEYIALIVGEIGNLEEEIVAAYIDVHGYATSQVGDEYSPKEYKRIFALYAQERYSVITHYLYAKRDGKFSKLMLYNRVFDL